MLSRPPVPDPQSHDVDLDIGFVTPEPIALPEFYTAWTRLISNLPELLLSKGFREEVDKLDILTTGHLMCLGHWQRAYVTLGFLSHAYIWQDKNNPSGVVPAALGDPFTKACEYLGMEPVLSYAGLCLWNWQQATQNEAATRAETLANFDNIKSYASFTGTRDEDAFYLVPVMVEASGGKLIKVLLHAMNSEQTSNPLDLVHALEACAATLKVMGDTLSVLHQNCDPTVFYHQIRPMIAGSGGAENKGLPHGVAFQRSDGSQVVAKCVGGSAGQSSLFQVLDHVFGVEHASKMLFEMRSYMSKEHRAFLNAIDQLPPLRDAVERYPGNDRLRTAFQLVMDRFKEWRSKHIIIVSRYIVQPAAADAKGAPSVEQMGTAGSLPLPFLKQYRDETILRTDL